MIPSPTISRASSLNTSLEDNQEDKEITWLQKYVKLMQRICKWVLVVWFIVFVAGGVLAGKFLKNTKIATTYAKGSPSEAANNAYLKYFPIEFSQSSLLVLVRVKDATASSTIFRRM